MIRDYMKATVFNGAVRQLQSSDAVSQTCYELRAAESGAWKIALAVRPAPPSTHAAVVGSPSAPI